MRDGRTDLAFDVITDEWKPGILKSPAPFGIRGDEHGDTIYKAATGLERAFGIPFGSFLRADRQVGNQDVGIGLAQYRGDVRLFLVGYLDILAKVLADAIQRSSASDRYSHRRDVGETVGIVRSFPKRVGNILADLAGIDVERRGDLDVADVITADAGVHQPGHRLVRFRFLVVAQPLNERTGTISNTDNAYAYLAGRGMGRVHVKPADCKKVSSLSRTYDDRVRS